MKKLLLFAAFAVVAISSVEAQDAKFGFLAGYAGVSEKFNFDNDTAKANEAGFFVGVVMDAPLSSSFHIQPELLYANVKDISFLYFPILAKYYVAESGFHLMAGPQANFILEDVGEGFSAFGLDITAGAGYDITENFFVEARYGFEVTNRIKDAPSGVNIKYNTLHAGVGYKF